jgi:hypothetical protein
MGSIENQRSKISRYSLFKKATDTHLNISPLASIYTFFHYLLYLSSPLLSLPNFSHLSSRFSAIVLLLLCQLVQKFRGKMWMLKFNRRF